MLASAFPSGVKPDITGYVMNFPDGSLSIPLEQSDFVSGSICISTGTSKPGEFTVGGCVIGSLAFSLMNTSGKFTGYDWTNKVVRLILRAGGQEVQTDDYWVSSHKESGPVIQIEAYDAFRVFDEHRLYEIIDDIKWPADAVDVIKRMVSYSFGNVKTTGLDGLTGIMVPEPKDDKMSFRTAMEYLCQLLCVYSSYRYPLTVAFGWYSTSSPYEGGTTFSHDLTTSPVRVRGVIVETEDGETRETRGVVTDGNVVSITGNPFVTKQNAALAASRIYDGVSGLSFYAGTVSIEGNPALESGDAVRVNTGAYGTSAVMLATNVVYCPGQLQSTVTADFWPAGSDMRINVREYIRKKGDGLTPKDVNDIVDAAIDDPESELRKKLDELYKSGGGGGGGGGGDTDWDQYDLPWYEDYKGKAGAGVDAIYRYLRPSDWMPMPTPARFEGYFLMLIPADAPARLTVGVNNSTARVELGYMQGGAFVAMEQEEVSHGFGTQDYTFDIQPRSWCPRTADGFYQMMVKISTPYVDYDEETGYYTGRAYLGTLHAACTVEAAVFDLDFPSSGMTSLRFIDVREGNANFGNLSTNLPHLLVVRQEGRSFPGGSSSLVAGFFDGYTTGQDRHYYETVNAVSTANCPRLLCVETGSLAKYDGTEAFRGNYSLRYLGDVTIESTSAGYLFSGCTSLTRIGNISAPNATGAAYMFENCGNLRKVGDINLPLVTALAYFGSGPDAIETVGDVYMPKAAPGTYFFGGTALREVGSVVVASGNNMFNGRSGLRSVGAIEVTTTASCASMFDGCANLRRVGSISMPENTACNRMFYNCSALSSPPAIIAGTVSNAENMYYGCTALEELPETPIADRATSCANMFYRAGIRKIESLDLPTASNTSGMFQYCQQLESVGEVHIGKNLTAAVNASRMFGNCTRLETAGDIYFEGKPTAATAYHNAESIFQSCYLMRTAGKITSAAPISLYNAFYACHRLEEAAGVQTDTEAVTANITSFRLGYMFRGLHNLQRVGDIDAPGVYDTAYMFSNCDGLNDFGRLSFGKSTAVNMFETCTAITEIEPFDIPAGSNISYMFNGCTSLTRNPVRNAGEASDITRLFYGCSDLEHAGTISDAGMSGTTAVSPFENCFRLHDVTLEPTRPVGWTLYGLLQRDQLAEFIRALPEKTTSGSAIIDMQNVMASAYITQEELAELTGKGYTYRVATLYEP